MKNTEFDIVVLGGGCIGSAIVKEISALGLGRVGLVDRGRIDQSATANSAGMIRVFHESLNHIDLALASFKLFNKMENQGQAPNGSLYFFNKSRFPSYQENLKKMDLAAYPFEVLTPAQGRERFPEFNWNEEEWAIYEPMGTHYHPSVVSEKLLQESKINGAEVMERFEATRICPYKGRFRICGQDGSLTTKSLIIAGGAKSIPLFADLGLSLLMEKRTLKNFESKKTDSRTVLPNFFDRETLDYGRFGDANTVVLAQKTTSKVKVRLWEDEFKENVTHDCYANNREGMLGKVPGHPGLFVATGWGGTAFKFSPEIGRRMSKIIESEYL